MPTTGQQKASPEENTSVEALRRLGGWGQPGGVEAGLLKFQFEFFFQVPIVGAFNLDIAKQAVLPG